MTDANILRCGFCGNSQNQVKKLMRGMVANALICNECISVALDILRDDGLAAPCEACADRAMLHDAGHVETQRSIAEWAEQTFGPAGSLARIAARANEEMAELLRAATSDAAPEVLVEEAADVVTILYRLVHRAGGNLHDAVDAKMAINRKRIWRRDGTGHAYHVGDA